MVRELVLSLFPGIDMFGRAFEMEGFTVVRGPDPAIGTGDIVNFRPLRRFEGIIAGPPCQDFSRARRSPPTGYGQFLLLELEKIILAVDPLWWIIENVPTWPHFEIQNFTHQRIDLRASDFGLKQSRLRHFQFGSREGIPLVIPRGSSFPFLEPCCMASEGSKKGRRSFSEFCILQGLPANFDIPYYTLAAKYRAVGNGVPIPMGRAIARAIGDRKPLSPGQNLCVCGCGRLVYGKAKSATAACRKRMERRRVTNPGF